MHNFFNNKTWGIFAAIAAIVALVILASGIGRVEFQKATPYDFQIPLDELSFTNNEPAAGENTSPFTIFLFWMLIILLMVIVAVIFSARIRKIFITRLIQGLAFAVAVYYVLEYLHKWSLFNQASAQPPAPAVSSTGETALNFAPPPFVPPDSNSPWSYIITLAILLVLFFAWWWYDKMNRRPKSTVHLDIAEIARDTVRDIQEGKEWGDTITRCYLRMVDAVNISRGIMRPLGMTPAEFATHLQNTGLPTAPVNRLTSLFENVRYGGKIAGFEEQQEAIMCLNSIIHACGGETS